MKERFELISECNYGSGETFVRGVRGSIISLIGSHEKLYYVRFDGQQHKGSYYLNRNKFIIVTDDFLEDEEVFI